MSVALTINGAEANSPNSPIQRNPNVSVGHIENRAEQSAFCSVSAMKTQ